jgi:hypothetical protein
MNIKLGQFIPVKDFTFGEFLEGKSTELYLPTEITVDEPQIVSPRIARVYDTGLYVSIFRGKKILTYQDIADHYAKALGGFHGTYQYLKDGGEYLYLLEVWRDEGSDGHTDYRLNGFTFFGSDGKLDKKYYKVAQDVEDKYGCRLL